MAGGNPRNFMRLSGRLVQDPTDLSIAFPHGGTALGTGREIVLVHRTAYRTVRGEEFGGTVVDQIQGAESARLTAILRQFDSDAVTALFPNTATGPSSSRPLVRMQVFGAGVSKPGSLLSARAIALLVSPDAPLQSPAAILYVALPLLDEQHRLQFSVGVEAGFAAVFEAAPNTNGKLGEIGLLEDLSLS